MGTIRFGACRLHIYSHGPGSTIGQEEDKRGKQNTQKQHWHIFTESKEQSVNNQNSAGLSFL